MSSPLISTINSSRKSHDVLLPSSNLLTVGFNATKSTSAVPAATSPAPVSPAPDSVSTLTSRLDSTSISSQGGAKSPPPPPVQAASPPPAYGLAQAEALYNYSSPDEGDLPLVAGQRITILEYGTLPPKRY
jgi:hypothetical protein